MPRQKLREFCEDLLVQGNELLGLQVGIVSRIKDETYDIIAVDSDSNAFRADETFPLSFTYCREVYEKGITVALTELEGVAGLCKHPLYSGLPLEAYIGAPIMTTDQIWGTLNFSSMLMRDKPFSPDEISFVQDTAHRISQMINDLRLD